MAWEIKHHDTAPDYVAALTDDVGAANTPPIDLTSATSVDFIMRSADVPDTDTPKVKAACTIVDAANGIVSYHWGASDTDTVGDFNIEFEIAWSDGTTQTVPNDGYNTITVTEDLDAS